MTNNKKIQQLPKISVLPQRWEADRWDNRETHI